MIEIDPFTARAVIKLFIIFTEGAHISVDFVHFGVHIIVHQLSQLKRVHAARSRAVFVVFIIAAAHAVHDGHPFRVADHF